MTKKKVLQLKVIQSGAGLLNGPNSWISELEMLVSSEKLRNSGIVTVRISKVKMKFDISDWSTCLMNPPSQW